MSLGCRKLEFWFWGILLVVLPKKAQLSTGFCRQGFFKPSKGKINKIHALTIRKNHIFYQLVCGVII
jgi:hypothetical protein